MNLIPLRRTGAFFLTVLAMLSLSAAVCSARTLNFSGRTWTVRPNGVGGPGPCNWSENNAWVDAQGQLHLRIDRGPDGQWYCAEVYTDQSLGFGTYQWHVIGRVDQLDKNIVLGLFPYKGPSGRNEIDIEMARWGSDANPMGNFSVWPAASGLNYRSRSFAFTLSGDYTTHRFRWQSQSVFFQMLGGHQNGNQNQITQWNFRPANPGAAIPQQAMPTHMNLWLFEGRAPSDGQPVEIIIKAFSYVR